VTKYRIASGISNREQVWFRGASAQRFSQEHVIKSVWRVFTVLSMSVRIKTAITEQMRLQRGTERCDVIGAVVTKSGKEFHAWVAATGKEQSPSVARRVTGTTSVDDEDHRRRRDVTGRPRSISRVQTACSSMWPKTRATILQFSSADTSTAGLTSI